MCSNNFRLFVALFKPIRKRYKFGYTGEGFATMSTNIRDFSNLIFVDIVANPSPVIPKLYIQFLYHW